MTGTRLTSGKYITDGQGNEFNNLTMSRFGCPYQITISVTHSKISLQTSETLTPEQVQKAIAKLQEIFNAAGDEFGEFLENMAKPAAEPEATPQHIKKGGAILRI